ncbi:hypothetical protein Hdeb2414_s0006g00188881 [Helianthus debilis subsp. tardiflorus]
MKCRIELEKARLLIFEVADQLDRFGNKKAHGALAMAKVNFDPAIKFDHLYDINEVWG